MKLSHVAAVAIVSCTSANAGPQDVLVTQGLFNLGQHVNANGYPEPKTCMFEKAKRRREWYVTMAHIGHYINFISRISANDTQSLGRHYHDWKS
jgi:hypothetical protein